MINAIVLAAGQSKRMGKPKPLLSFQDTTFLGQIISVLELSKVDAITVVLGCKADIIQESLDLSSVNIVINPDYEKGQLSSLVAGLKTMPTDTDAILLCLVDNPFITTNIVNTIIETFEQTKSPIVLPATSQKRGHPALFSRELFDQLINAPEDKGARHVVHSNAEKVAQVQVTDENILISIDTPEEYVKYFGTAP